MNILILSWRGPVHPNAGGAEQVTVEHIRAWLKAGHKVTWFTSIFRGAKKREVVSGIDVVRSGRQILEVQLRAFCWYLFAEHPDFDLVIDHFHGLPFFTPLFVKKPKLAVLQEVARDVWKMNHLPFPLNLIIGNIGYYCEPLLFLLYKKIPFMVGSQSAKGDLAGMGIPKENIKIVNHGVKLTIPKPLPKKEKVKTMIFLGALAKDKGVEDVIKVFNLVKKKNKGWKLWIVGKGAKEYLEKLKSICRQLSVEKDTKFWGFVSEKKKFELLARAHVFVNPSVREGWGLVNIEANAVGTPVVAYKVAGIKDSVKDGITGILVEAGDYRDLAQKAILLVEDKKLYYRCQKNALEWSKKFSWSESTEKSLKLIQSI